MKEKTQSVIFLVVLGVVGYFAYQYFIIPWLDGNDPANPTASGYSLLIPEECQTESESLRYAFHRHEELGNLTQVGLNGFIKNFRSCLRRFNFPDSQIDEAVDLIKNSR